MGSPRPTVRPKSERSHQRSSSALFGDHEFLDAGERPIRLDPSPGSLSIPDGFQVLLQLTEEALRVNFRWHVFKEKLPSEPNQKTGNELSKQSLTFPQRKGNAFPLPKNLGFPAFRNQPAVLHPCSADALDAASGLRNLFFKSGAEIDYLTRGRVSRLDFVAVHTSSLKWGAELSFCHPTCEPPDDD